MGLSAACTTVDHRDFMESRIATTVFVMGLIFAVQAGAQSVSPTSDWRSGTVAIAAVKAPEASAFLVPPVVIADQPAPTLFDKSSMGGAAIHSGTAQLAGLFKPQSSLSTPANRIPFYVTAPYWLPRSRPFPQNSMPPAGSTPRSGLINDMASLIWPGSKE